MRVVLMYSLGSPSQAHLERLHALATDLDIVVATDEQQARAAVHDAEVILGHRYLRQSLPGARRLRWVQSSAGSVDRLPLSELAKRRVILSRSTIDSEEVAAHAVTLAWAVARALPEAFQNQRAHAWQKDLRFGPMPHRGLVLGVGPVGAAIVRRLDAHGIRVICARRRKPDGERALPCERWVLGGEWRDTLAHVDWCFLALPHTSETADLFDENALRSLRRDAVLVNVGRGQTLDTRALIRVLNEGHLTGAALDVVAGSPLPPQHPLWTTPRLLVTPHIASHHPGRNTRLEHYFEQQLARYLAAEPLLDQVDLTAMSSERPADGELA